MASSEETGKTPSAPSFNALAHVSADDLVRYAWHVGVAHKAVEDFTAGRMSRTTFQQRIQKAQHYLSNGYALEDTPRVPRYDVM